MTKHNGAADKNLQNVVEALDTVPVNSHQAQQLQQDKNDRRNKDVQNHDKSTDMDPSH
ncbi:hypothetical protein [Paenibacillus caui]|uniref:hypothetical protein n=1 Tax=Paenibacillus caui TaxID=2873927 RepID=UPI001CA813AC|nr:hypothetical protein [Paenibacillus caui]